MGFGQTNQFEGVTMINRLIVKIIRRDTTDDGKKKTQSHINKHTLSGRFTRGMAIFPPALNAPSANVIQHILRQIKDLGL